MSQAFLGSALSEHLARLPDGGLLVRSTPIARTGTQLYRPSEVFQDGSIPPRYQRAEHIRVIRTPQEVLSPRTIASAEGSVLTDQHPPVFVSPSNFSTYAKGHIQNVRVGPTTPDGERTLVADLIVRDHELSNAILTGRRRDISLGYSCEYSDPQPDGSILQTNIEVNHCACVTVGRAGHSVSIMDELPLTPVFEKFGRVLACAYDALPETRPAISDFFSELEQGPVNQLCRSFGEIDSASNSQAYAAAMRRCWRK